MKQRNYQYVLLFSGIFLVYILFMFVDIMDVDAAQYASIAYDMMQTGSYLEVYHRGQDYLDKPPLLFWLASLSFKLFGVSNFTYKLPAVLFLMLAVYSTFRLARLWYTENTARIAALILATTQAFFFMSNDVRTDGILTGAVAFTVWQIAEYLRNNKWHSLGLAALGLALGMMAKGPVAAIVCGAAVGGHLLYFMEWKKVFDWRWLLMLGCVLILLVPMCYGLYIQYDLHPEKEVYGLKGPSGLKFFFWTQSFGRVTGGNYWSNDTGFFYFFHTILWDMQPWVLLFYAAILTKLKKLLFNRIDIKEAVSFFGFILPFLALSTSNYKLPHYVFVLFPFAAILTADFIDSLIKRWSHRVFFAYMQLYYVLAGLILFYVFPGSGVFVTVFYVLSYLVFLWWYSGHKEINQKLIFPTAWAAVSLGFVMATVYYPQLLNYQGRSEAGKLIAGKEQKAVIWETPSFAMDFYARKTVALADTLNLGKYPKGTYIYAPAEKLNFLLKNNYQLIDRFNDFPVSQLNATFLNPERREEVLKHYILVSRK
jgi:4-amino-4-deoxy-L-arabinose transferase-like glycosyltransferase